MGTQVLGTVPFPAQTAAGVVSCVAALWSSSCNNLNKTKGGWRWVSFRVPVRSCKGSRMQQPQPGVSEKLIGSPQP